MKKFKIKYVLILLILFTLYLFVCAYSYVNAVSTHISDSVFRLHVIANSDSNQDQELKYVVRDNLLKYMNSITKDYSSKQDIIRVANENIDTFYSIAKQTILDSGFDYDVNIEIGNFYFPTKNYGDISLPSGNYDSLKIEIGKASGQNWWCVMFPPLCFVDVSSGIVPEESKQIIQNNLSEEEYTLVSENNSEVKFKFKLVEWFQNNIFTANNK